MGPKSFLCAKAREQMAVSNSRLLCKFTDRWREVPTALIDDIFSKQANNAIWSIFDLDDGFHQMHLAKSSRLYTAFATPWGLYPWTVLLTGLKGAPKAYQRIVCRVLHDFTDAHGTKPYVDDSCHGTPNSEDNFEFDVPPTQRKVKQAFSVDCFDDIVLLMSLLALAAC